MNDVMTGDRRLQMELMAAAVREQLGIRPTDPPPPDGNAEDGPEGGPKRAEEAVDIEVCPACGMETSLDAIRQNRNLCPGCGVFIRPGSLSF